MIVIDIDLGQSGANAAGPGRVPRLVAELTMGHAGMVLGLECPGWPASADWHQLRGCARMAGTLICDEDGLYDPRTLTTACCWGMKGTMSEVLCRHRHSASYADLVVMPTTRQELVVVSVAGCGYPA